MNARVKYMMNPKRAVAAWARHAPCSAAIVRASPADLMNTTPIAANASIDRKEIQLNFRMSLGMSAHLLLLSEYGGEYVVDARSCGLSA